MLSIIRYLTVLFDISREMRGYTSKRKFITALAWNDYGSHSHQVLRRFYVDRRGEFCPLNKYIIG